MRGKMYPLQYTLIIVIINTISTCNVLCNLCHELPCYTLTEFLQYQLRLFVCYSELTLLALSNMIIVSKLSPWFNRHAATCFLT
jgi:hypothetical protein